MADICWTKGFCVVVKFVAVGNFVWMVNCNDLKNLSADALTGVVEVWIRLCSPGFSIHSTSPQPWTWPFDTSVRCWWLISNSRLNAALKCDNFSPLHLDSWAALKFLNWSLFSLSEGHSLFWLFETPHRCLNYRVTGHLVLHDDKQPFLTTDEHVVPPFTDLWFKQRNIIARQQSILFNQNNTVSLYVIVLQHRST